MPLRIKHILSVLTLGLFIFFIIAQAPDGSTSTEVDISNCEPKPAISITLTVNASFVDENGKPVESASISIFIVHQLVNNNESCTYSVFENILITRTTDASGHVAYTESGYVHQNSQDLFRIEVYHSPLFGYGYSKFNQVKVGKYANATFNFTGVLLKNNNL